MTFGFKRQARIMNLATIHIVEDRYGGVYSKAKWVAVANYDERNLNEYPDPFGDDEDAMEFWWSSRVLPDWIAAGDTPNEALDNLYRKNGIDP